MSSHIARSPTADLDRWAAVVLAAAGTAATFLLGAWTLPFQVLVAFIVLDYIGGVTESVVGDDFDWQVGFKGVLKKLCLLAAVAFAHLLDGVLGLPEPFLRTLTVWLLVANEGGSIVQHLAALGVPVPEQVAAAVEVLKSRSRQASPGAEDKENEATTNAVNGAPR